MGHTELGSLSVAGERRLGVPQAPASRLSPSLEVVPPLGGQWPSDFPAFQLLVASYMGTDACEIRHAAR
jgi:hypothetical protein